MRPVLVTLLALLLMVAAIEAAMFLYPPVFLAALAAFDSQSLCTSGGAFSGAQNYMEWTDRAKALRLRSVLVQEEDGLELWQTPGRKWWIPAGGAGALPWLLAQQQAQAYDFPEGFEINPGDVVLDCGAHVGVFAARALSRGARLVVAIEPSPKNLVCLRRNFETEIQEGRVMVIPKGVWDKEDTLTLYTHEHNSAADSFVIQINPSGTVVNVPLTTIDLLVEELGLGQVDFIKMDIKGAAVRALDGARRTLRRDQPRLSIATEENDDHPALVSRWVSESGLGYRRECGACAMDGYKVYPAILSFH